MSQTAGVKPMAIAGRFVRERERLLGMTDEDRMLRKQWLRDQELAHFEPVIPPGMYKEQFNIIRRIYRAPLNLIAKILRPILGEQRTIKLRFFSGKIIMGICLLEAGIYYFKYNTHTWMEGGRWKVLQSRPVVLPGDPCYPFYQSKEHYADYGFSCVTLKL